MQRRTFLKRLATTSAGLALTSGMGTMPRNAYAKGKKQDFGEIKSLKVECVSETSWFDNPTLGKDIKAAGGINTNQYDVAYNEENLGGYAALIVKKPNIYWTAAGATIGWIMYSRKAVSIKCYKTKKSIPW